MSPSGDTDQHKAGDQEDASTPFQPQALLRPRSATIRSEQPEVLSHSETQGSIYESVPSATQGSYNLDQGIQLGNFDRSAPPTTSNQNVRPILSIKSEEVPLRFGCPYYKRSPNEEPKQRSCVHPGFKNIARLKEHLYRHHMQPRCVRCNEQFNNIAALDEHQDAGECQVDYGDGLDQEQESRVENEEQTSNTKTDVEKWKDIYQTLFSDHEAVPTPYCHDMPLEHAPENAANDMNFDSIDLGDGSDAPNTDLNLEGTNSKAGTGFGGGTGFSWGATSWGFSTDKKDDAAVDKATNANNIWNFGGSKKLDVGFNFGFSSAVEEKNEGDDWGWGTATSKKDKKKKKGGFELLNKPPLPPPKPEPLATTDATADDIRALGDKQDNLEPEPEPMPPPPPPPGLDPAAEDDWGEWRTADWKKDKKDKMAEPGLPLEEPSLPPEEPSLASDFPPIIEPTSDQLTLVESTVAGTTLIDTRSEAMTLEGQLRFPTPGLSEQHHDTDHDYASVVSNDEDIASKSGSYRSREEVLAVKELGHFFAELEDLLPLHQELLEKLGPERFSENYRRILKLYFLGLQREAKTIVEKQTALLLKKRFNRYTIAQRVAYSMQTIGNDDSAQLNELSSQQVQKELGHWLAQLDNTAPQQSIDEQNERTDESNDEAEDGDHFEEIRIASIEQAKTFLRRGDPFQDLVLQLRLLALPLSIRDVLDMASMGSIAISSINDNSLMNRAKAFAEDYTRAEWDWWPLMPRVPDVGRNRFRLQWEVCGQPLCSEISPKDAESLRNILAVMDGNPPECSDYGINTESLSLGSPSVSFFERIRYWAKQNLTTSSFASVPSTAQQRYTPPGAAKVSSGTPSNSSSGQNTAAMPSSSAVQSGGLSQAYGVDHNGTHGLQNNHSRIIFGIRSKFGLDHIETIGTRDDLDDSSFFGELKSRHDAYRPFLHRWLSPFRFRYCNFVRFEHVFDDPLFSSEEGLPAWLNSANVYEHDPDYDYSPKPPRAKNPPIDSKLFSACLAACNTRCGWSSMSGSLHKCCFLSKASKKWMRIPRKKTALTKDDRVMFGIEAEYALSFAMLFVYHAVLILAALPSGYIGWRIIQMICRMRLYQYSLSLG